MLNIPGTIVHQFRTVVRKGLGITRRQHGPVILVTADTERLRIRAQTSDFVLELTQRSSFSPVEFAAPFDLFRECGVSRNEAVSIELKENQINAYWADSGIPKSISYVQKTAGPFPVVPDSWATNPAHLLKSFSEACATAEPEASRFALSHLRLRGSDGQVVATDGRLLFAEAGFAFPWEDACLVPGSKLFGCSDLKAGTTVDVGRSEDWITLRTGNWTIWLKLNKTGRFPEIDSLIQKPRSAPTTLRLAEADAQFLLKSLKHLPGGEEFNAPVTVDLNGAVTCRAVGPDGGKPTELVLTQSVREGAEVRFAVNRHFLARATKLGFRQFVINSAEDPVVASDGNRTMVWANLSKGTAIKPKANVVRVESPGLAEGTSTTACAQDARTTQEHAGISSPVEPDLSTGPAESTQLDAIVTKLRLLVDQASEQMALFERILERSQAGVQPRARFSAEQLQASDA